MEHPPIPELTRARALDPTVREFHAGQCAVTYGATGHAQPKVTTEVWRRNGATQTWKRDPDQFRIPIKHGLYAYGEITQADIGPYAPLNRRLHAAQDCAVLAEVDEWWRAKRAAESEAQR